MCKIYENQEFVFGIDIVCGVGLLWLEGGIGRFP